MKAAPSPTPTLDQIGIDVSVEWPSNETADVTTEAGLELAKGDFEWLTKYLIPKNPKVLSDDVRNQLTENGWTLERCQERDLNHFSSQAVR